ncbi:MAG: phenylalanine 4-monooxygenase [Byssovorax sp.]
MTANIHLHDSMRTALLQGDYLAQDIVQLTYDHPGRQDSAYQSRRDQIAAVARSHDRGEPVPEIDYTGAEHRVWRAVRDSLLPLHSRHACKEYQAASARLSLNPSWLPQLEEVNRSLQAHSGFRMIPVMGFVSPRTFMRHLGEGMFLSTQYVRYPTTPLFSPEPDVIHELTGHACMMMDPRYAALNRLFGAAAEVVDEEDLHRLERVFWYTLESGLVRESDGNKLLGAALLSSGGEIEHCFSQARQLPFDLERMAATPFEPTKLQDEVYVAESFATMIHDVSAWLHGLIAPHRAGDTLRSRRLESV